MKAIISAEMLSKLEALQNGTVGKVIFTPEEDEMILQFWEKKNKAELSKLLGYSENTIRNRFKELNPT